MHQRDSERWRERKRESDRERDCILEPGRPHRVLATFFHVPSKLLKTGTCRTTAMRKIIVVFLNKTRGEEMDATRTIEGHPIPREASVTEPAGRVCFVSLVVLFPRPFPFRMRPNRKKRPQWEITDTAMHLNAMCDGLHP